MRKMFHDARLVHGDLSEYNLLYHNGTVYVIDVGQAVTTAAPKALEFLAMDCRNVSRFFSSRGIRVMSPDVLQAVVTATAAELPSLAGRIAAEAVDGTNARARARVWAKKAPAPEDVDDEELTSAGAGVSAGAAAGAGGAVAAGDAAGVGAGAAAGAGASVGVDVVPVESESDAEDGVGGDRFSAVVLAALLEEARV